MTRFFLVCLFSLFMGQVFAQPEGGRRGNRPMGVNMDSLKVKLALTDDQVQDLEAIRENMRVKRREVFEENQGDREAVRAAMEGLRADADTEMKEILTLEQWNTYEILRKEMREKRGERPREGRRPRKGKKDKDTENGN